MKQTARRHRRIEEMRPNKQNKSSGSISLPFNDLDSVRLRILVGRFHSCPHPRKKSSTSLPGGNQVDGLPPASSFWGRRRLHFFGPKNEDLKYV